MIGKATSLLLTIAFALAAVLYSTSFKAKELERELASVNGDIAGEYDKIQVLKAEWALLNDPERIERLAKAHLVLRPADPHQFGDVAALPTRRSDEAPTPVATAAASVQVMIDGRATQVPLPGVKPAAPAPNAVAALPPGSDRRGDSHAPMIAGLNLDRRTTR